MTVKPLHDRVLIKRIEEETKTTTKKNPPRVKSSP